MRKLTKEELPAIAPLFEGVQETMVWSCLQGLMGEAYAEEETPPACAQLLLGDFCFFGGDARAAGAAELAGHIPRWLLAVPPDAAWEALIEQRNPGRFERVERYAFEKDPSAFDRAYLARLAAVPAGYQELPIGRELYEQLKAKEWSRDLVSQFPTWEDYRANAVGTAALCADEPVCGASTYAYYEGGIEIEIDTAPEHRQRGLATACAARLILPCLDRGLYPSWDAANPTSAALAEKLGYRPAGAYVTYAVTPV